jgi:hypothetical protein
MAGSTRLDSRQGSRTVWWVAGVVLAVLTVVVTVWLLVGRDGDTVADGEPPTPATAQPTPTATEQPPTTPTPSLSPTTPQPPPSPEPNQALAGATFGPFSGEPSEASTAGSWIADVRSAGHNGFDRVVLEFDGDYVPTYRVAYTPTAGPFRDVPGDVVPVEGAAFLDVWLQGTSSVDMSADYEPVYTGPDRIRSDTAVVTEVVSLEDFEANVHWLIGLDERTPFVVWTTGSPSRLVIDIAT